jgi:hypothetical protein
LLAENKAVSKSDPLFKTQISRAKINQEGASSRESSKEKINLSEAASRYYAYAQLKYTSARKQSSDAIRLLSSKIEIPIGNREAHIPK